MKWMIGSVLTAVLALGIACGSDEATKSAEDAAAAASDAATGVADAAAGAARDTADAASGAAADAAAAAAKGAVAENAVAACKAMAARGAWGEALEACKKAHEMMPDDMGLEHAYQQAQAAAK